MKHFWKLFLLSAILVGCHSSKIQEQATSGLPKLETNNFNFIVANDMGKRGESEQQHIADIMGKEVADGKISMIAVAGDPIHDDGVKSVTDNEWKLKFENIYTAPSLQNIPWYVIPGNHEYRGSVQAILDYSKVSKRWHAPARYFSLEKSIGSTGQTCLLVFIDTSPLIDKYRTSDEYSDAGQQSIDAELNWMKQTIESSHARWKIVIGHHPVYAYTEKAENERTDMQARIRPILEKYHIPLYICGHIHNFQHILLPGSNVNYVVNSSASLAREVKPVEGTQFCSSDPGFSVVSVSNNNLKFYMVNHKGETIYNYTITH